jgi:hypothetical protein
MTLQQQVNAACAARGYLPQAILVAPELAAACRKGRELFDWEAGGGMARVARAMEHCRLPIGDCRLGGTETVEPRTLNVEPRKEYNPRGKEDAVLSRMNGHPMKLAELRGELNVMTLHQVLNRLMARGAVRKVKWGLYEKVVTAGLCIFASALLMGCQTRTNAERGVRSAERSNAERGTRSAEWPPLPAAIERGYQSPDRTATVASVGVEPKVLRLEWDKNDDHPETVTQVWQSPTLTSWTLYGEFAEPTCQVTADQPKMFYKIRNRLGNQVSEWGKK